MSGLCASCSPSLCSDDQSGFTCSVHGDRPPLTVSQPALNRPNHSPFLKPGLMLRTLRSSAIASDARSFASKPSADSDEARCSAASMPLRIRSEEHTSELQSLMRISYAVFCLKKKTKMIMKTHRDNNV